MQAMRPHEYFLLSLICLVNMLGMFFVAFGAAAGGERAWLVWPAITLLAGGILLLAVVSALRASQLGLSPWPAFVAAVLGCVVGPLCLALVIYLTVRAPAPAKGTASRPKVSPSSIPPAVKPSFMWGWMLLLFLAPWLILLLLHALRSL